MICPACNEREAIRTLCEECEVVEMERCQSEEPGAVLPSGMTVGEVMEIVIAGSPMGPHINTLRDYTWNGVRWDRFDDYRAPGERVVSFKHRGGPHVVGPAEPWSTGALPDGGEGAVIECDEAWHEPTEDYPDGVFRYEWKADGERPAWGGAWPEGYGCSDDGVRRWRWVTRHAEQEALSNCWWCGHRRETFCAGGDYAEDDGDAICEWLDSFGARFRPSAADRVQVPRSATGCPGFEAKTAPAFAPPQWTATADRTALVEKVQELEQNERGYVAEIASLHKAAEAYRERITLADESADAAVRNVAQLAADLARMTNERDEALATTHMEVRAGYDRTVADTWRAHVGKVERQRDLLRGIVDQAVARVVESKRTSSECIVRLREREDAEARLRADIEELCATSDGGGFDTVEDRWPEAPSDPTVRAVRAMAIDCEGRMVALDDNGLWPVESDRYHATLDELAGTVEANEDLKAEREDVAAFVYRELSPYEGMYQRVDDLSDAAWQGPDALLKLVREG